MSISDRAGGKGTAKFITQAIHAYCGNWFFFVYSVIVHDLLGDQKGRTCSYEQARPSKKLRVLKGI